MHSPPTALHRIEGPPPMPILGWRGNMVQFLVDPIAYMMRLYREHGGLASFTAGENGNLIFTRPGLPRSPRTYFAFSPEANYDLLTNTDVFVSAGFTGPDTPAYQNQTTNSIFAISGDRHRRQRRLIMPAFHKKRVE